MESLSGSKGWKRIGKLKKHSKTPIYSDLPGHLVKIMCMCCSVVIGRKWAVEGFVNVSVFSALTGSKTAGYLDIKHGLPNVTVYLLPLSVSLSAWLPFRLSVCLSVRLSVCLSVSPSKGNRGTIRGKEKIILTSVGIELTTSRLDLSLLCRLSYEAGQRKSGTIW